MNNTELRDGLDVFGMGKNLLTLQGMNLRIVQSVDLSLYWLSYSGFDLVTDAEWQCQVSRQTDFGPASHQSAYLRNIV
jgi:hypothetical protein